MGGDSGTYLVSKITECFDDKNYIVVEGYTESVSQQVKLRNCCHAPITSITKV